MSSDMDMTDDGQGADLPEADEDAFGRAAFLKDLEDTEVSEDAEEAPVSEEAPASEDTPAETLADLDDGAKFSIKMGDKSREVTGAELRELLTRESDISSRHQAAAEAERAWRADAERVSTALNAQLARAEEGLKAFDGIDWFQVSKELSAEDWTSLKDAYNERHAAVAYFKTELDGHVEAATKRAREASQSAATAAHAVLSGPEDKGGIPGWSPELYAKIVEHAVSSGMPQEHARSVTDPAALRLMNDAMRWRHAQAEAAKKMAAAKAAPKPPLRMQAPNKASQGAAGDPGADAMARLRRTGDVKDAAKALFETLD